MSIDDYYKVMGYACIYKADVQQVDIIKAEEITITFVCKKYPQKLINYLKEKERYNLKQYGMGIYYVFGELFPMQIVVTSRLSKTDNFWLKNLTNDLKDTKDVKEIFHEYSKNRNSNLHKSIMDIIVKANEGKFKEVQGDMCDALMELMKDVIDEKVNEKVNEKINEKVNEIVNEKTKEAWNNGAKQQLLDKIAKKLSNGKSVEQIADELEETVEMIEKLIQEL